MLFRSKEMTQQLDKLQAVNQDLEQRLAESEALARTSAPGSSPTTPAVRPGAVHAPAGASRDSRRLATPCLVVIHRGFSEEMEGWAVERTMEGLKLLVDETIGVGSALKVRSAKSAHPNWIDIIVQDCRQERGGFQLSCSFATAVTWADIQQLSG